ncbi:MAG: putative toxin-antitoxin system toxin component, PIN family [Candidatus Omnitrophota bacterium]
MKIPKVVIDTNVFVSAVLQKGSSTKVLDKWKEDKFVLLISPGIFDEYFEVIARPRFNQSEADIRELVELLTEKAVAVEPRISLNVVKGDPDDNKFLECAISGEADFVVSGDRHLLDIEKYQGIEILKIAEFILKIGNQAEDI